MIQNYEAGFGSNIIRPYGKKEQIVIFFSLAHHFLSSLIRVATSDLPIPYYFYI